MNRDRSALPRFNIFLKIIFSKSHGIMKSTTGQVDGKEKKTSQLFGTANKIKWVGSTQDIWIWVLCYLLVKLIRWLLRQEIGSSGWNYISGGHAIYLWHSGCLNFVQMSIHFLIWEWRNSLSPISHMERHMYLERALSMTAWDLGVRKLQILLNAFLDWPE